MGMSMPGVEKDYEMPCVHCGIDLEWNRCEASVLVCTFCGRPNRIGHECCDLYNEHGDIDDSYCLEWLEHPYEPITLFTR